jgi:hypothetical protein
MHEGPLHSKVQMLHLPVFEATRFAAILTSESASHWSVLDLLRNGSVQDLFSPRSIQRERYWSWPALIEALDVLREEFVRPRSNGT